MKPSRAIASTESIGTPATRAVRWLLWTAASFPIAVLSHELAHYAASRAFGFQGVGLHYGSSSYAVSDAFWARMREGNVLAASRLLPPWQAGVAAAAGLLATYATVVVACVMVARRRPHPFWVGLGLIAPLRFLGSVAVVLGVMLGRHRASGSDEEHVALTLHIPELALHALGIAVLIATWVFLLRIPSRHIRWGRFAVLAGIVVGGILYIGVVGPRLLP